MTQAEQYAALANAITELCDLRVDLAGKVTRWPNDADDKYHMADGSKLDYINGRYVVVE